MMNIKEDLILIDNKRTIRDSIWPIMKILSMSREKLRISFQETMIKFYREKGYLSLIKNL